MSAGRKYSGICYNTLTILFSVLFFYHPAGAQVNYADYVDPRIESAKSRYFYFSSACRPFGMVNLSPDNVLEGTWNSGYRYNEPYIRGFTHVHCWGVGGLLLMPVPASVDPVQGPEAWKSRFSHDKEIAKAGYHQVYLDDHKIKVELTSSTRVGFHRYTFDKDMQAKILLSMAGKMGSGNMKEGFVKKISNTEIEGWVDQQTEGYGFITRLFFVIQFSKAFNNISGWTGQTNTGTITDTSRGDQSGMYVSYDVKKGDSLKVKVGLSWCSTAQAKLNLVTEVPHWNFNQVWQESVADWNKWLGRIEVRGGTKKQKIKFYTDVWHALLGRRQIQDVNGMYPDNMKGYLQVKQLPLNEKGEPAFMLHNSDSYWLTMWNLNTLWSMAYPEVMESFVNSALVYHENSGFLPRGPIIGRHTWIMTGSPITELIVSAYMHGIRGYDIEKVYAACKKAHMPGGTMDMGKGSVQQYIDLGYIPEMTPPQTWGGAGRIMEYTTQDWALAQLAKKLGKEEDAAYFMKRSASWINMFDPTIGFIRPKNADGSWLTPFDPLLNANYGGFVESNSWQATWMAVHDVKLLANLLGGYDAYCKKLNYAFENSKKNNFEGDFGNTIISYSNQPGLEMAHLFNYAGKPWLSQYWVRRVHEQAYSGTSPFDGYGGNDEDQGQMGALSALMALGLFDIKGGCDSLPTYQITTPLFDTAIIHLDNKYYPGKTFTIINTNNKPDNVYIQSASLNGKPLQNAWFYHDDFKKGGVLKLTTGPNPNKKWGIDVLPPSETTGVPSFSIAAVDIPSTIKSGELFSISYEVKNNGSTGTYFGKVNAGNKQIARQELILKAGESKKISYPVKLFAKGTQFITIPGTAAKKIIVAATASTLEWAETDITSYGDEVRINLLALNNGSDIIDTTIDIGINKKHQNTKRYHLLPGDTQRVQHTYVVPASGVYTIKANTTELQTLSVVKPSLRPEKGLVFFYDFADQRSPLLDISGYNHHPFSNSSASVIKTMAGRKGLELGKTGFLKFKSTEQLNIPGSVTYCLTLYPLSFGGSTRILQKGRDNNQFLLYSNRGKFEFKLYGVQNGILQTDLPKLNAWTTVVCMYDSAASLMSIWFDGVKVASKTASGATILTGDNLFIGAKSDYSAGPELFNGLLNEIKIYNRVLSADEIKKQGAR